MRSALLALFTAAIALGSAAVGWATEQDQVEAIRQDKPTDVPAPFVAAVKRIDELRGQIEFADGKLVEVDLSSDRVSVADDDLHHLAALPNLRRLRLTSSGMTTKGIEQISGLAGLTELAILQAQIDAAGLKQLARLSRITSLTIQRSAVLDNTAVPHLALFPKLTHLALIEANLTDAGVEQIVRTLPNLRLFDVRGCGLTTNAGFARLPALKQLRVLRVGGAQVNDQTLAIVGKMTWLTGLTVQEAAITNAGLGQIARLPLEDITLFRCYSVDDEGLAHLAGMKKLRQATLRDLPITGTGLVHLADKEGLVALRLSETGIDDAALVHLVKLRNLRRLDLHQTRVGDAGLASLAGLTALEQLDLSQTAVTTDGLKQLAAALPRCRIAK